MQEENFTWARVRTRALSLSKKHFVPNPCTCCKSYTHTTAQCLLKENRAVSSR